MKYVKKYILCMYQNFWMDYLYAFIIIQLFKFSF